MLKAEQSEPITEQLWKGAGQQLKKETTSGLFFKIYNQGETEKKFTRNPIKQRFVRGHSENRYTSIIKFFGRFFILEKLRLKKTSKKVDF